MPPSRRFNVTWLLTPLSELIFFHVSCSTSPTILPLHGTHSSSGALFVRIAPLLSPGFRSNLILSDKPSMNTPSKQKCHNSLSPLSFLLARKSLFLKKLNLMSPQKLDCKKGKDHGSNDIMSTSAEELREAGSTEQIMDTLGQKQF